MATPNAKHALLIIAFWSAALVLAISAKSTCSCENYEDLQCTGSRLNRFEQLVLDTFKPKEMKNFEKHVTEVTDMLQLFLGAEQSSETCEARQRTLPGSVAQRHNENVAAWGALVDEKGECNNVSFPTYAQLNIGSHAPKLSEPLGSLQGLEQPYSSSKKVVSHTVQHEDLEAATRMEERAKQSTPKSNADNMRVSLQQKPNPKALGEMMQAKTQQANGVRGGPNVQTLAQLLQTAEGERDHDIAQCMLKTFQNVIPILNAVLRQAGVKRMLEQGLKAQTFAVNAIPYVTFHGPVRIQTFGYDSITLVNKGTHVKVEVKGLKVYTEKLGFTVEKKLFGMFLETGQRQLLFRRQANRLRKGGFFKKIGKGIKKGFKRVGKFIKKAAQVVVAVVKNKIHCTGDFHGGIVDSNTNFETNIHFEHSSSGPKIRFKQSKLTLGNIHADYTVNKVCSILPKSKVLNRMKEKVREMASKEIDTITSRVAKLLNDNSKVKERFAFCKHPAIRFAPKSETQQTRQVEHAVNALHRLNTLKKDDTVSQCLFLATKALAPQMNVLFDAAKASIFDYYEGAMGKPIHLSSLAGVKKLLLKLQRYDIQSMKFSAVKKNSNAKEDDAIEMIITGLTVSAEVEVDIRRSVFGFDLHAKGTVKASLDPTDFRTTIQFTDDPTNRLVFSNTQVTLGKLKIAENGVNLEGNLKDVINEEIMNLGAPLFLPKITKKLEHFMQRTANGGISTANGGKSTLKDLFTLCDKDIQAKNKGFSWVTDILSDKSFLGAIDEALKVLRDSLMFLDRIKKNDEVGQSVKTNVEDLDKNYGILMDFYSDTTTKTRQSKYSQHTDDATGKRYWTANDSPQTKRWDEPFWYKSDDAKQVQFARKMTQHARRFMKSFLDADPETFYQSEVCAEDRHRNRRVGEVATFLSKLTPPLIHMAYHTFKLVRTYEQCKQNGATKDECHPSTFLKPLRMLQLELMEKDCRTMSSYEYDNKFEQKGWKKRLSLASLLRRLGNLAAVLCKRVLYRALSQNVQNSGPEALKNVNATERFFHQTLGHPLFRRRLDGVFRFLRDTKTLMNAEERRDKQVEKLAKTRLQQDIDFVQRQLDTHKRAYPDNKRLADFSRLVMKVINTVHGILPRDVYINLYNPSWLGNVLYDYAMGNWDFASIVIDCYYIQKHITAWKEKAEMSKQSDKFYETKVDHMNYFYKHILTPLIEYNPNDHQAADHWRKKLSLPGTFELPGGTFKAIDLRFRRAECAHSAPSEFGHCSYETDPCNENDASEFIPLSSRCVPCKLNTVCPTTHGSNTEIVSPRPRLPWNTPVKLTVATLRERFWELAAAAPPPVELDYQFCILKETTGVTAVGNMCPNVKLPEPNMFKLFLKKETVKFDLFTAAILRHKGTKEVETIDTPWITRSGNAVSGFKCTEDCLHCYGDDGYFFSDIKGYEIAEIPSTTTYNSDPRDPAIPWIRGENWDAAVGKYRPRCECEHSYNGPKKCDGEIFKDVTMVCELVRNGGIMNGCHEGHFVIPAKKGAEETCILVNLALHEATTNHSLHTRTEYHDITFQCARNYVGSLIQEKERTATRPMPTAQKLTNTCPSGFSRTSALGGKYCRKDEDSFDKQADKRDQRRRSLLQHQGATS